MKLRQRSHKKARIEIIPMIDVIFFLLVFFMISSLAATHTNSLPVSLPKTSSHPDALKQDVILTIRKDGKIYINQEPVDLKTLGAQLAVAMEDKPEDAVVVRADEESPYGLVIQAMDQARQIGVRKFALASEAIRK